MIKGQAPYADPNMNPYIASQMQHVSAQRVQHNIGTSNFPGRPDSYDAEAEHPYKSSKGEGQWQWNRDAQNVPSQMASHSFIEGLIHDLTVGGLFKEVVVFRGQIIMNFCKMYHYFDMLCLYFCHDASQGSNRTRSYYQGQTPDPKLGPENQTNKEARTQPHEQDMDIGYEDNSLPLTFEGLEWKFLDEIMKLAKEQSDAEDAENSRHREKIIEINCRYQEKLSALCTQQANRREESLSKESQARLSQHQQSGISHYTNTGFQDVRGYSGATGELHQVYATNQLESYRDQPQFVGGGRTPGAEGRVPYPKGRVYNSAGAHYY